MLKPGRRDCIQMGNSRIFDCQLVLQGLLCTAKCVSIDEGVTICLCTYRVDAFVVILDDDYGGDDDGDNNNNNNVITNENLPSSTIITFLKYGCLINEDID
jgi:hypothetical protein